MLKEEIKKYNEEQCLHTHLLLLVLAVLLAFRELGWRTSLLP